jgi:hypothetical protein
MGTHVDHRRVTELLRVPFARLFSASSRIRPEAGREIVARQRLYAARMVDVTLDEWLKDVTGLVSALAKSESQYIKRLQQLRRETDGSGLASPASTPSESPPFDPRRLEAAVSDTPLGVSEERFAEISTPAGAYSPAEEGVYVSREPRRTPHSQEKWTSDSGEHSATSTSTTRSYDYFAELDEKLAALRQLSPEA